MVERWNYVLRKEVTCKIVKRRTIACDTLWRPRPTLVVGSWTIKCTVIHISVKLRKHVGGHKETNSEKNTKLACFRKTFLTVLHHSLLPVLFWQEHAKTTSDTTTIPDSVRVNLNWLLTFRNETCVYYLRLYFQQIGSGHCCSTT